MSINSRFQHHKSKSSSMQPSPSPTKIQQYIPRNKAHHLKQQPNHKLPSRSTNMPPFWDPMEVLDLPTNHHNCVGRTAQHSHCGARIHKDNAAQVETIVRDMALLPADSGDVYELLISLAQCGLCKHYHRRQHPVMVWEWVDKIEDRVYTLSKEAGRGSVGDVDAASKSLRWGSERPSPHKSALAGPAEVETVHIDGMEGSRIADNSRRPELIPARKYLLALPAILMVVLVHITIATLSGSSPAFSLAFSAQDCVATADPAGSLTN
jgi:hypothetical protein